MKVSVVVPVRNEETRVAETFDSIFAQTLLPDEIVVADGCSTDDTVARIEAYSGRGTPIRVVRNESLFAGGGRNAATRAASHDILVNMDVGNRADPAWLESIVQPFKDDPSLDYVGGIYYPILDTWFERTSGAIVYFDDCIGMTWTREELERHMPPDPLPGGNCMAYRRAIWERVGGFCEWAKKGQDRLFSLRVRHVGGNIAMTLDSIMHHHMAGSIGQVFNRHFSYERWIGRMALSRGRFSNLARVYLAGLLIFVVSLFAPPLALAIPFLLAAYVYAAAWRKLDALTRATGQPFSARQRLWSVIILFVRDAAVLSGNMLGSLERLVQPRWRRKTNEYLLSGVR